MSDDAPPRPKLAPWNASRVTQEVAGHLVLLFAVWFGGLGYFGLALLMSAELLLICSLSILIFPERGVRRHLWDMLKLGGVTLFLLLFVFVTGGEVLRVGGEEAFGSAIGSVVELPPGALAWAVLASAVHIAVLAIQARRSPQPRIAWVQLAIMNGGITVVWLLLLIPLPLLLGSLLVELSVTIASHAPRDTLLVLAALALRLAPALLVTRMPAKDIESIAGNPYVD